MLTKSLKNLGMAANKLPRVTLDTNILISALVFGGKPDQIFDLILQKQITAITSPVILSELVEVLTKKFHFGQPKLLAIENKLKSDFELVQPTKTIDILKDKPDNRILEAALESKCSHIITGDKRLLDLGIFRGVKIVTADQFLREVL